MFAWKIFFYSLLCSFGAKLTLIENRDTSLYFNIFQYFLLENPVGKITGPRTGPN